VRNETQAAQNLDGFKRDIQAKSANDADQTENGVGQGVALVDRHGVGDTVTDVEHDALQE
jgi:hypothetical protein